MSCSPRDDEDVPGLSWTSDSSPGLRRVRKGRGFCYYDPSGERVNDAGVLSRVRSLAVPPAWVDVWIAPDPTGHIQATGRDARGRKQYVYHPRWREHRDATKYSRMLEFGRALPRIRKAVDRDLRRRSLSRRRVTAAVVSLLDQTSIRVGSEQYARQNGTFGLTTLRRRSARVSRSALRLRFPGKGGKPHEVAITSPRVARVVAGCGDLPGQLLFQYTDEGGAPHPVSSNDVNDYLRETGGGNFTAKDFRTWSGSTLAAGILAIEPRPGTEAEAKATLKQMLVAVSRRLGNTPTVCRQCYVHPLVVESYYSGELQRGWSRNHCAWARSERDPAERLLLWLLARHQQGTY